MSDLCPKISEFKNYLMWFAYLIFEVIKMAEKELIDGKLYLRRQNGSIEVIEDPFEIELLTDFPKWLSHFDD